MSQYLVGRSGVMYGFWNVPSSAGALALGLALAVLQPAACMGAGIEHVAWEALPVAGHVVRLALAEGVITGKAVSVEQEALVLEIKSSTNPAAYPKGPLRVPRDKVHVIEMQRQGHTRWALLSVLGALGGLGAGAAVAVYGVEGGDVLFNPHLNTGADAAAIAGMAAGGFCAGYFGGKALDKHWTRMEIVP
jgi:hypothetical protein